MASDNSKSIIAMVVVCLLVVFVFVALAVYFIRVHRRQRHEPKDEEKTPATTEKAKGPAPLSERVQALAVTSADVVAPFNVPQYSSERTPGANMRVACLRPDGSWEFTYPGNPATMKGLSDVDIQSQLHASEMAEKKRAEATSDDGASTISHPLSTSSSTSTHLPSPPGLGPPSQSPAYVSGQGAPVAAHEQEDDTVPPPSYSWVQRSVLSGR